MRFLRGHNMRDTPYPESQYIVDRVTQCWIWQLGTDRDGYGLMWKDGKRYRAHRWFYEQRYGPLSADLVPDHRCPGGPNRACVNPDHMEPATVAENSRRKQTNKLTLELAEQIRSLEGQMSQAEIGARFGVAQSMAWRILRGKSWPKETA